MQSPHHSPARFFLAQGLDGPPAAAVALGHVAHVGAVVLADAGVLLLLQHNLGKCAPAHALLLVLHLVCLLLRHAPVLLVVGEHRRDALAPVPLARLQPRVVHLLADLRAPPRLGGPACAQRRRRAPRAAASAVAAVVVRVPLGRPGAAVAAPLAVAQHRPARLAHDARVKPRPLARVLGSVAHLGAGASKISTPSFVRERYTQFSANKAKHAGFQLTIIVFQGMDFP